MHFSRQTISVGKNIKRAFGIVLLLSDIFIWLSKPFLILPTTSLPIKDGKNLKPIEKPLLSLHHMVFYPIKKCLNIKIWLTFDEKAHSLIQKEKVSF